MRRERRDPPSADELAQRFRKAETEQRLDNLPGFYDRLRNDSEIKKWVLDQMARIEAGIRDADEVLFEQGLGSWLKACWRINELVAEDYRQANPDPETWELRFFKWMTRVVFIRFECSLGEFYLVPRKPRRRPVAKHWFTAQEMIDILGAPATVHAITTFGQLPVRPESLPDPAEGEKHLHVDFSGDEPVYRYHLAGGPRYAGKGFR